MKVVRQTSVTEQSGFRDYHCGWDYERDGSAWWRWTEWRTLGNGQGVIFYVGSDWRGADDYMTADENASGMQPGGGSITGR